MILFGKLDLLRRKIGRAGNSRPRGRRMSTSKILRVFRFMALGTIGSREMFGYDESAMVHRLLIADRTMALEARHACPCVMAHFKLMNHGRSFPPMAFGTFPHSSG
jgi:hypothetical protein